MAKSFIVFNSAHDGYRRANISFAKGDNVIAELSAAQIQQITNDKRLVLQKTDPSESADPTQLVANADGVDTGELTIAAVSGAGEGEALPPAIQPPEELFTVITVIQELATANALELTNAGVPTTACLEAAVAGLQVSAKTRDAAWQWIKDNPEYNAELIFAPTNSEGDA